MAPLSSLTNGDIPSQYPYYDIANIIFCLYNEQYWLYAIESYLYNLYYLAIVSYICRAYILKYRRKNIEKGNGNKKLVLKQNI